MKGLVGVVIAIIAISSYAIVDILNLTPFLLFTRIIPAVFSILAIILGVQARRGGAKIWGLASITLGVVGAISHILGIIQFTLR